MVVQDIADPPLVLLCELRQDTGFGQREREPGILQVPGGGAGKGEGKIIEIVFPDHLVKLRHKSRDALHTADCIRLEERFEYIPCKLRPFAVRRGDQIHGIRADRGAAVSVRRLSDKPPVLCAEIQFHVEEGRRLRQYLLFQNDLSLMIQPVPLRNVGVQPFDGRMGVVLLPGGQGRDIVQIPNTPVSVFGIYS